MGLSQLLACNKSKNAKSFFSSPLLLLFKLMNSVSCLILFNFWGINFSVLPMDNQNDFDGIEL